jgi:SAM-dependent methyltransferase
MSFGEDFVTFFQVRLFNCVDLCKTIVRYWRKPKFALVDLTLLLSYFFKSPYRIAREFNDTEPYGETPLATLDALLAHCQLDPSRVVYELGSGRGRAAFWLALYKGYTTVGIEHIPTFTTRAQKLAKFFKVNNVNFIIADICTYSFENAGLIYLFGSALPDESITELCNNLHQLPSNTYIITISYPLEVPGLILEKTVDAEFSWGTTQAYIQRTKGT